MFTAQLTLNKRTDIYEVPIRLLWNVDGYHPLKHNMYPLNPQQYAAAQTVDRLVHLLSQWPSGASAEVSKRYKMDLLNLEFLVSGLLQHKQLNWNIEATAGDQWLWDLWKRTLALPTDLGDSPCCWEERERMQQEYDTIKDYLLHPEKHQSTSLHQNYVLQDDIRKVGKKAVRTGATMLIPATIMTALGFLVPPMWISALVMGTLATTVLGTGLAIYSISSTQKERVVTELKQLYHRTMEGQKKQGMYWIGGQEVPLNYCQRLKLVHHWCKHHADNMPKDHVLEWYACRDNFQRFLNLQSRMDAGHHYWSLLLQFEAAHLWWGDPDLLSQVIQELIQALDDEPDFLPAKRDAAGRPDSKPTK